MRGDLDGALKPRQDLFGMLATSPRSVMEHDPRRQWSAPAPIIAQDCPKIAGPGLSAPRVKHRRGGFVHVKPGSPGFQQDGHPVDDRRDMRAHPAHPVGKNGPVDREAVTGHDPRLPVQRHMFGVFGHGDMRQHRFGGPTALQKVRGGPGLNDAGTPLRAGVFRADRHDHPVLGRHHVDPFGPVLSTSQ